MAKYSLTVYALCDPRDNRVRYIGLTSDPSRRLNRHIASPHSPALRAWIDGLAAESIVPIMRTLETVDSRDYPGQAESWWIRTYSFVCPGQLLNGFPRGDFVYLYALQLSSRLLRDREVNEGYRRKFDAIQAGRAVARAMLSDGERDIKKIASECGISTSFVWDEFRSIERESLSV